MNRQLAGRRGFTVIEVTLFLSITGLMMLGIFVGINGAITRQIYENEVISLIDFVQGEYNMVDNVRNNRAANMSCSSAGLVNDSGSPTVLGSSDCTLVGRLIVSDESGELFLSSPVYSLADASSLPTDVSERQYLRDMQLRTPDTDLKIDQMTHSTRGEVYTNGDTGNRHFSILIVKLPTSGMTRTYVIDRNIAVSGGIGNLLDDDNTDTNRQPLRLCVNTSGFGVPQATGVRIVPSAGSVAGVQRISASDSGDQGC